MRTFTSTITVTDWPLGEAWGAGSGSTTKSVRIKRWAMRRRRDGIGTHPSSGASRRTGNRCAHALEATSHREPNPDQEIPSAGWTGSQTELENRPPAAVEKGTQETRGGRAALVCATSFSLSQMIEARGNRKPKQTGAASRNASLKNAPSGSNIGVHFSSHCNHSDSCSHASASSI